MSRRRRRNYRRHEMRVTLILIFAPMLIAASVVVMVWLANR